MAVLLLAEVHDGALALDTTAEAVTAAQSLGHVSVLCVAKPAPMQRLKQQYRPGSHMFGVQKTCFSEIVWPNLLVSLAAD